MDTLELFPNEQVVGVFRGFREGGLEFHADLALPYRNEFQRIPMHGQFLLVQLESPEEAVLGRIASFSSEGKLSFGSGEEFNIRAVQEQRSVPEDLREQYLRYRVNIRVLGVLKKAGSGSLVFVPSHRRLPHVGSAVAFPSGAVLREICGHNVRGADIGFFALGEYVYSDRTRPAGDLEGVRLESPEIVVRFPMSSLVARRTFVFARAGFGKSNLNKLLFSKLYNKTPTVTKRREREVPVGTVIFDPDGEYFWPDDKGRPGLCDVPHLLDQLVVFTARQAPSAYYGSFVAGGVRLDIRQIRPSDVISIALPPERQDQQNVAKLRALSPEAWRRLVDLIDRERGGADLKEIGALLKLDRQQEAEAIAARSNMTNVVGMLHDKSSQFMRLLLKSLEKGKLCVVDVSQMRGKQAFVLAGIVLRRIFDRNQEEFTRATPRTIPTIAVIEEAQAVLNERAAAAEPYISWVKEGRKYDLGALLITQQPGAIPNEILSQGDNWFLFHLLSSGDLTNVKRANAHFSDDLLSSLLNEPIPGHGIFWSSVGGNPYPVSMRAFLFEEIYEAADPRYNSDAVATFARSMREESMAVVGELVTRTQDSGLGSVGDAEQAVEPSAGEAGDDAGEDSTAGVDLEVMYRREAAAAVRDHEHLMAKLKGEGAKWGYVCKVIEAALADCHEDPNKKAFELVKPTIERLFGQQDTAWRTIRKEGEKAVFIQLTGDASR